MHASIIIVTFNGSEYLQTCIDSILDEIRKDDEIILVDNASTDGCASLVQQQWPQVRLISNHANLGFAAACNQGAKYATGETLVFLNQDTRVEAGWLTGLLVPFGQYPTVGLVASKLLLMSAPGQIHMCGQDIHFTGFSFGRGFRAPSGSYSLPEVVGAVSGASFAIRRELWEQLGGFDLDYFMYYEETDLCWRARLAGFSSMYTPDSIAYHDFSTNRSSQKYIYSERNRLVLILKNLKPLTLILLLPSLLISEIIDWGYMLLVGREGLRAKLQSYRWLARNFSTVRGNRAQKQLSRKERDWVLLKSCTSQLTPQLHTGGRIGHAAVSVCNLWFRLHYKVVLSLAQYLNI